MGEIQICSIQTLINNNLTSHWSWIIQSSNFRSENRENPVSDFIMIGKYWKLLCDANNVRLTDGCWQFQFEDVHCKHKNVFWYFLAAKILTFYQ